MKKLLLGIFGLAALAAIAGGVWSIDHNLKTKSFSANVQLTGNSQGQNNIGSTTFIVPQGGTGVGTLTGLVKGNGTSAFSAVTTSAGIAGAISDETGSGALVFGTSPAFTTPNIGSATGSITGNAGTATALQNARTINGTSFDGTGNITVTAAAGTLTGTTLNSTVVTSSLTSVGTISTGVWSGTAIAVNKGGTGQTTYTDGQLLIGNTTGNTLAKATLTAGSGVTITNGSGTITIAASGGSGVKIPSYTVCASGCDFSTIQAALDQCATDGGATIALTDHTYTQAGTGLRWKGSFCNIYGRAGYTTITFTGATTYFKTNSAVGQYTHNGVHDVVITGDANASSVAIDFSDMSHQSYSDIIIDSVATGVFASDTQNITFYNEFTNFDITTLSKFGINLTTTNPVNDNIFTNFFTGCSSSNCIGVKINQGNNNKFYGFRAEPSTTTGTIGVDLLDTAVNDGTFDNQFYGSYLEANGTGVKVEATLGSGGGVSRNSFIGGIADANTTDISDAGVDTVFSNFDKNFTTYHQETFNNTGLGLYDTDGTNHLTIAPGSNLTANRTLTITTGDASRTITLTGNLTMSGANNLTLTTTGSTNVTLPTTGTLVADTVATLSSLSSIGTITTGTWSATTIAVNKGGTGQTTYTDGQLLIGNTTGNTLAKATLTGTSNQVVVTNGSGTITLSTPQSIGTASTPQFARLGLGQAADSSAVMAATGQYFSTKFTDTDAATIAVDWNSGNVHYVVIGATGRTVTFSNPKDGARYVFMVKQDGTGSRTITTWPATVLWPGGTAPTLTTGANKVDIIGCVYDGTNTKYYCAFNQNF